MCMCEETLRSSMHCRLLEVEAVRRAGDALATRASVTIADLDGERMVSVAPASNVRRMLWQFYLLPNSD